MIVYSPLIDLTDLVVSLEHGWKRRNEIAWVPLRESEVRLSAHFYPLCVEIDERLPRLGAIVSDAVRSFPLVDDSGQWLGAYEPMALRCFPFRFKRGGSLKAGIFQSLEVARPDLSQESSPTRHLTLRDSNAEPTQELVRLHRQCAISEASGNGLSNLIQPLLAADILVPLALSDKLDCSKSWLVVHPDRLSALSEISLAAIARSSLAPIEIAVAMAYSQRVFSDECQISQDQREDPALAALEPTAFAPLWELSDYALDESTLYSSNWLSDGMEDPFTAPEAQPPDD